MNRPTWATIVGILGIVFGGIGLMNAVNTAILPYLLEWQKGFMQSFIDSMPAAKNGDAAGQDPAAMFETLWGPMPSWFKIWCLVVGLLGIALSAAYIYSAISMLQMKRQAIRLFYLFSGAAIVLALTRGIVAALAVRMMGLNVLMASVASIAFHIVMMLVVQTSNKSAYFENAK